MPLAEDKQEGPTTCLTFLGITIDSIRMELRLPVDKLVRVKEEVDRWSARLEERPRASCTQREFSSLVGLLQHASTVVRPGRTFLRRMYDKLAGMKKPQHRTRLGAAVRSDLAWWRCFLRNWNGVSLLKGERSACPDQVVTSDASGSWGCGAFWDSHWFQLAWNEASSRESIFVKELVPCIVVAAAVWGANWRGQTVLCRCDNQGVVAAISSRTSKVPAAMHLLRSLFLFEAQFDCQLVACHIPGCHNELLADDLSRNRLSSFIQKATRACSSPTPIPPALVDLLMDSRPDWTSAAWTRLFSTISREAWQSRL